MTQPLLPLDTAFTRINELAAITKMEIRALSADLNGRFLAENVYAPHDVPPFHNSAVDGFALPVAAQNGAEFNVKQYLPAGSIATNLEPNTAAQVFTGGTIPNNTAAVIMREDTEKTASGIRLKFAAKDGAHIRNQGEDFACNSLMFQAGQRLDARHIAALAVVGVSEVSIAKPLKVGVFSAGNEVQDFGTILQDGAIHDGNRPALCGLLQRFGMNVTDLGIVPDQPEEMESFITEQKENFDVVFASAGMSESDTDYTANTLNRLGEMIFWQLGIKPARPVGLARFKNDHHTCYILGLPGNPASCLLAAWLIGLPLLHRLSGGIARLPKPHYVESGFALRKKPHRREFIRVRIDQLNIAQRVLPSGSATLSSFVAADGVLDLPEGQDRLEIGDKVTYYPFTDF